MNQLYDIKNIEGKDVTFLKLGFEDTEKEWITAYVRLPNYKDDAYLTTYSDGDVFGIDTAHGHNKNMALDEKFKDAQRQIAEVIKHYNKQQKEQ